jgi:hypothetical protein
VRYSFRADSVKRQLDGNRTAQKPTRLSNQGNNILGRLQNLVLIANRVTAYFDASGGVEHPVVIVAGYVSTVGKWEHFDYEWRKILGRREFNVPYFHMKEFAHSVGPFADWKGNEPRRRRFINALVGVIAKYAKAGFACMIKDSIWNSVNQSYPLEELYGCAFALAGRDCVNKTHHWGEELHNYKRNEIKCVFEAGDKGKGHLMRVVEEAQKPIPLFEYGRPKPQLAHPGTSPLQAADFAAWELLKIVAEGKEGVPFLEHRVTLQKLSKAVPVSWTQYKAADFMALLSLGNIKPRSSAGV